MRLLHAIAIAGSLLALASCQSTHRRHARPRESPAQSAVPGSHGTNSDDFLGVQRLLAGIMAADNAGDLDRVMTHYTDDAVLLPPKGPKIIGLHAIRAHYVEAFEALTLSMSATVDTLRSAGDWAMVEGEVSGTITEKATGAKKEAHDRFLAIVVRGDDAWRFSRLSWAPLE